MWIYVWNSEIKNIYLWDTPVKEVYLWDTKIRPTTKELDVEYLLVAWGWAGVRWGWGWGWIIYCQNGVVISPSSCCIVIWAWGTPQSLNWWDSYFGSMVACWWWGWNWCAWGSWWWSLWVYGWCWIPWQWCDGWNSSWYSWGGWGWYSETWCKGSARATAGDWWEWLSSNISWANYVYSSWGWWASYCDCSSPRAWGEWWTWAWNGGNWRRWGWTSATNYGWWWGGTWMCNSGGAWCGKQWVFILRYPSSCWYNITWWTKYLCNWYCIHCFTSNWTLTVS